MNFSLVEVSSPRQVRQFLDLPLKIYKDDPNWIQPLDKDIEEVFDPGKNKTFRQGKCSRWLLLDDKKEVIGRVAAFTNKKYKQTQPTGGIGFFECSNDQQAANFMLDHCREWLRAEGMEAMDGPINFGERDRWWGMVTEGFREPLYAMNYNPPYYNELFTNYGFRVYFYQECMGLKIACDFHEKLIARRNELRKDNNLRVEPLRKKDWQKYARDFATVYNKAWASHGEGKTIDERQALKIFKSMKPVMDERITWFTYYKDEPIACWLNLPDLNQYFKHLHGKFGLLQKLKFLWLKKTMDNKGVVGLVFGVVPEWQGKGIDAFMVVEGTQVMVDKSPFEDYEMQWVGDFNPKMLNVARSLRATRTRQLATYRYLFDRQKEFVRHPILKH